ncbi:MAG: tetratricopeptide repeat protein [Luteolibacter sp.]
MLEFILGLAGVGVPTDFYVSSKRGEEKVFVSNRYFIRPYFGTGVSRGCLPFIIPENKPDDTARIFVLGASAAQGDPDPAYGISRQLEVMLEEQFSDQTIEVYNVAITATNSHVTLPVMRACVELDPDLFIIYLGNNEVVGPYGAGSVFSPLVKYRWLISLQTKLRGSRSGQWLSSMSKSNDGQPEEWKGMEMFLDNPVTQESPMMQTVYKHYGNNLRSMFKVGSKHDVPVVISTVAVNLKDNAPFGSHHKASLDDQGLKAWDTLFTQGTEEQKQGKYTKALESYHEAVELDDQFADLHFRIAECYLQTDQIESAKKAYEKARDLDVFRFRADSRINQIIEETAADFDTVTFIDGEEAVEANSPNGIPGAELFYEHVHFNFSGNYLLAKTLNPVVLKGLKAQSGMSPKSSDIISEAEMKKRLAYTRWDQLKIARHNLERMEKPPFTNQFNIETKLAELKGEIQVITSTFSNRTLQEVLAEYEYALGNHPHWFIYDHLADIHLNTTGDLELSETYYQKAVDEYPHYTTTYDVLAKVKLLLGKYQEAEEWFRKSLAVEPTDAHKITNLAVAIGYQERYDEAIPLLRDAIKKDVYAESAYFTLAAYLFNRDSSNPTHQKEASKYWQIVLEKNPNHVEAQFGLAKIQQQQGNIARAIEHLEEVLSKDPNHQRSQNLLEQLRNN